MPLVVVPREKLVVFLTVRVNGIVCRFIFCYLYYIIYIYLSLNLLLSYPYSTIIRTFGHISRPLFFEFRSRKKSSLSRSHETENKQSVKWHR